MAGGRARFHRRSSYHEQVTTEQPNSSDATLLMVRAAEGDRAAADALLPLVYDQLRRAAQVALAAERQNHTLSATALVHEAYLKLVGPRELAWANRRHFYSAAAEAMRQILLDHARARGREKRGGDRRRVPLSVTDVAESWNLEETVSLDQALRRLESRDTGVFEVVRLRFYAGLSIEQTAEALSISPATAKRWWEFGRTWLYRELQCEEQE
jgi:RNA polymerase sigma factor (TIGR02999 family)